VCVSFAAKRKNVKHFQPSQKYIKTLLVLNAENLSGIGCLEI